MHYCIVPGLKNQILFRLKLKSQRSGKIIVRTLYGKRIKIFIRIPLSSQLRMQFLLWHAA